MEESTSLFTALFLLVYEVGGWVIRIVMLTVVVRNRRPSAAMAWLLIVFFMPWPGLILYLLIGNDRLPKRRLERHAQLLEAIRRDLARIRLTPEATHPNLHPGQQGVVDLAHRLSDVTIAGGNSVELLADTDETIRRLCEDIRAATGHVQLMAYIFADDDTGRGVVEELIAAAERGVTCRVIVDAVGSRPMLRTMAPRMRAAGIPTVAALPANPFRRQVARLDIRNHRKLAVIDGVIGYTGSQNIVNREYGHEDLAWEDLMVRVTGPVVPQIQSVFVQDWFMETGEMLGGEVLFPQQPVTGTVPAQCLPSGPNYPMATYQRMVVAAVYAARKHVVITSPYFVPDEPFMDALEVAVLRGVEVSIVLPARYDQHIAGAASRSYYEDLLDAGVKVYLYRPGLIHSKTMTVDYDLAFVGTSNFDIRSFRLNFEVNMVFYEAYVAEALLAQQESYIANSDELTIESWSRRPVHQRLGQNLSRLLSPLL